MSEHEQYSKQARGSNKSEYAWWMGSNRLFAKYILTRASRMPHSISPERLDVLVQYKNQWARDMADQDTQPDPQWVERMWHDTMRRAEFHAAQQLAQAPLL